MTDRAADPATDERGEFRGYLAGFVSALALTAVAFALVRWPVLGNGTLAMSLIFALALAQAVVHFRFFLHIGLDSSTRDDLQLILFSTLIVVLMVSGTLVVLLNLRHRMM